MFVVQQFVSIRVHVLFPLSRFPAFRFHRWFLCLLCLLAAQSFGCSYGLPIRREQPKPHGTWMTRRSPAFPPREKVSEGRMRGKSTWQTQVYRIAKMFRHPRFIRVHRCLVPIIGSAVKENWCQFVQIASRSLAPPFCFFLRAFEPLLFNNGCPSVSGADHQLCL